MNLSKPILVTGATGYVGGRLIPRLLDSGYRVRVFTRDAARLQGRDWLDKVEVAQGDALSLDDLKRAMDGCSVAYYLIHGMQGGKVNAQNDLKTARNFEQAAEACRLENVIYLGELVDPTVNLSPYLRARHETGYVLRYGRTPVTEFRAGMIVGSGSALFEMMRYLVEREPILICPRWFFSKAQPIAIRDALSYLIDALRTPECVGRVIEIGGPAQLTYAEMLLEYAKERNLKRKLIRAPVYAPRLSAYWVHLVTPIHWSVVAPLIEGFNSNQVTHDDAARRVFPHIQPIDFATATRLALRRVQLDDVETSWSGALVNAGAVKPYQFAVEEGMFIERRQLLLDLPPEDVFRAYTGIGGERGWLYMDWAWALRGWMDKVVGGVGLRRGRRSPDEINAGEALDFWRVQAVEKNRRLRLLAEMKVPGKAWLEFTSFPQADGKTLFTISAYFAPHGAAGFLYWYAMWPFHKFIFDGMARELAKRAALIRRSREARP